MSEIERSTESEKKDSSAMHYADSVGRWLPLPRTTESGLGFPRRILQRDRPGDPSGAAALERGLVRKDASQNHPYRL
jgi:hypothetical protein